MGIPFCSVEWWTKKAPRIVVIEGLEGWSVWVKLGVICQVITISVQFS